ncbi:unnamed protein product [Dicrocoelium dendriticum]|nr:unnamed protein product [Dicrocoelium dendriticum]
MGKKQRQLRLCVILLTYEQLDVTYGRDSTVEDIFHEVCNIVQLDERELFGLAVRSAETYLFLDPSEKASDIDFDYLSLSGRRYFSKLKRHEKAFWLHSGTKSDSVASTDRESIYPTVYFRVRFYIPLHCVRLRSTVSIYYEQLRTNVLEYGILCAPSSYVQLSALALQAEYGDAPVEHGSQEALGCSLPRYFDPSSIYPEKLSGIEFSWLLQNASSGLYCNDTSG